VFEAEELELSGEASVVEEANAHKGKAVRLAGADSSDTPAFAPKASLRVEFEAPPGSYYVWLRAKAESHGPEASVWFQVNDEIGTRRGKALSGVNRPVSDYPANAFAWASKKPGYQPERIQLQSSAKPGSQQPNTSPAGAEKFRLLVSTREGKPVIDQIVLSTLWSEHPVHNLPLAPGVVSK
jgi:hypothetical protein